MQLWLVSLGLLALATQAASMNAKCINARIQCMLASGRGGFGGGPPGGGNSDAVAACVAKRAPECAQVSKAEKAVTNLLGSATMEMDKAAEEMSGHTVSEEEAAEELEELEEQLGIDEEDFADISKAIDNFLDDGPDQYLAGEGNIRFRFKKAVFLKIIRMKKECNKARANVDSHIHASDAELNKDVDFRSHNALPDMDGSWELEQLYECVHGPASLKKRRKRQVEISAARKWRNNLVNYVFCRSSRAIPGLRHMARLSAKFIQQHTCVRFRERMAQDVVVFTAHKPGCVAHVGRQGGPQMINLRHKACHKYHTVAQHWLMALGLRHTIQRTDRDQHVRILSENIEPSKISAFQIKASTSVYGLPYQYQSVMHPVAKSYSRNGQNTIEAMLGDEYTATMGSAYGGPSFFDLKLINLHYCPTACPGQTCENEGYPNPNNCARCVCPEGFCGARCERLCDGGPQSCGAELTAESEWKCINSPNYPEFHAKGQSCAWLIRAPESHMRVEWKFEGPKFAFAYTNIPLCMNYVELRYQESLTREGRFFCGYKVPDDQILSLRDFIFVNMANPVKEKNYYGFKGCYRISPVTNTPPDPIDCSVESWTAWSDCSCSCNGGFRERRREVISGPRYNGKSCEEIGLTEQESCNTHLCPIDCEIDPDNQYEPWGACMDVTGAELECGKGVQTREQIILIPAENGGKECPVPDPSDLARECDMGPCVVDCELYPLDSPYAWDACGECSTTCGDGVCTRRRIVKRPPLNGGKECDELGEQIEETMACEGQLPCPVDCQLGPWQIGECDVDCGVGTQTNTREVLVEAAFGGEECGDRVATNTCDNGPCPIDCVMGEWSEFGPCTAECGGGSQQRSRDVVTRDAHGGAACPVEGSTETESRECNASPCPVDCVISDWSAFSACTVSCGGGEKRRSRTIRTSAANGGDACPTNLEEVEPCNSQGCPLDCIMTPWSAWSSCSRSCGGGLQDRARSIRVDEANGGKRCGAKEERQACNEDPCPIDCLPEMAAPMGSCSKYCGGGVQTFQWIIERNASYGGRTCEEVIGGPVVYDEPCNTKPCPIPCKLNSWEAWGPCDAECDGGVSRRIRTIRAQPKFDGTPCDQFGLSEERPCNGQDCVGCEEKECDEGEYCSEEPGKNARCYCEDNYRRRYGVCEKMECYCPEP